MTEITERVTKREVARDALNILYGMAHAAANTAGIEEYYRRVYDFIVCAVIVEDKKK